MNFESKENSQPALPEKKEYKLDKGGDYRVFKKICEGCSENFSIYVPNKEPDFNFMTKDNGKISVKELEKRAKAKKLCPQCESNRAKQENKTEQ
ncbi:hypothetical protein L6279_04850 [Candidatus Parcubacteria bacterium]|nr:hypothetical protein [Patescibacteria group bacterium]MCG2693392.1 hypothetical protein [Candidatus Parcubacteria bacterium]